MTALSDSVRLGVWLAGLLNLPLTIGGREVRVPADLATACAPVNDTSDDAPVEPIGDVELGRRIAYIIDAAGKEIATLGIDLGVILDPAPEQAAADHFVPAFSRAPEPPAPDTSIEEVGGETWIGSPPIAAVRSSDGTGSGSWCVVSFKSNTILSWHARKGDAVVWAIAHVRNGTVRGTGDVGLARRPQQQTEK